MAPDAGTGAVVPAIKVTESAPNLLVKTATRRGDLALETVESEAADTKWIDVSESFQRRTREHGNRLLNFL